MSPAMSISPLREDLAQHGFESIAFNDSPSNRRQRISMACHYCRHRKIRCCGGAPCRNCTRSNRECDYAPVPEEVNRATREKKASAKLSKISAPLQVQVSGLGIDMQSNMGMHSAASSPMSMYTPYMHNTPTFDMTYVASPATPQRSTLRPAFSHRRTHSTPAGTAAPWAQPPPAPLLHSPAMLESSGWMYNAYSSPSLLSPSGHVPHTPLSYGTPVQAFPSVLEQTPLHEEFLAVQAPCGLAPPLAISTPTSNSFPHMPTMPQTLAPATPTPHSHHSHNFPSTAPPTPYTPHQGLMPASSYYRVPPPPAPLNLGLGISTPALEASGHFTPQSHPASGMQTATPSTTGTSVSPPLTPAMQYPPTYRAPGIASYYAQANLHHGVSPTLAPALEIDETKSNVGQTYSAPLMGLGIAMPQEDVFYSPALSQNQGYFGNY